MRDQNNFFDKFEVVIYSFYIFHFDLLWFDFILLKKIVY
jgi:hypothetical protein